MKKTFQNPVPEADMDTPSGDSNLLPSRALRERSEILAKTGEAAGKPDVQSLANLALPFSPEDPGVPWPGSRP